MLSVAEGSSSHILEANRPFFSAEANKLLLPRMLMRAAEHEHFQPSAAAQADFQAELEQQL